MTGTHSGDSASSDWRNRAEDVGRRHFGREERLRLGFATSGDEDPGERGESDVDRYTRALDELSGIRRDLNNRGANAAEIRGLESIIGNVRAARGALLKADRDRPDKAVDSGPYARPTGRLAKPTFLGHRVSRYLKFEGGDSAGLSEKNLPVLESFLDIAEALEITTSVLQWLTYERGADTADHYTRFAIPKRAGGRRLISTPKPAMRAAQQWIRTNVLVPLPVSSHAAAFRPGKSIVDNAGLHSGKACVIRLDLKDFFGTVTFNRVRGFFESLGYNPGVATVFALLCTDAPRARVTLDGVKSLVIVGERSLPQGACTSPDLANLITVRLDARVAGLARKFGYTYSRYADDLVLSTDAEEVFAVGVISAVGRVCAEEGFRVNHHKTRIMRPPNRQLVTGLIVNDGVRLTRSDLRRVRAFFHRCEMHGLEAVSAEIGKDAQAVAHGHFAYIYMVSPGIALRLLEKHPWI